MEADSYVRGGCLDVPVDSRLFTDGASSVYDGTPLVERSVARVRNPPSSEVSALLMVDAIGNTDPVCINQLPSWASRLPSRT